MEQQLLLHEDISQVAVFGVDDDAWGQRIAALVVLKEGAAEMELGGLRNWGKERMASYRVPSILVVKEDIPKNAMGKVNKKELLKLYEAGDL